MEDKKSRKIKIDIVQLAKIIVEDKKLMLIYCGIGAVISIIVAFSIPRIYKSRVMLAPEETSNGFSGNISSTLSSRSPVPLPVAAEMAYGSPRPSL